MYDCQQINAVRNFINCHFDFFHLETFAKFLNKDPILCLGLAGIKEVGLLCADNWQGGNDSQPGQDELLHGVDCARNIVFEEGFALHAEHWDCLLLIGLENDQSEKHGIAVGQGLT